MTGTRAMMPGMSRSLDPDEHILASVDGKTGRGGCEHCDATYEIIYAGMGIGHLRIRHTPKCPIVVERMRRAFLSNRDPGDEQP